MTDKKRYVHLRNEGRNILVGVYKFFQEEKEAGIFISLDNVIKRTAAAMCVSPATVKRIIKLMRDQGNTDRLPIRRLRALTDDLDVSLRVEIKNVIYELYERKEHVTLALLKETLFKKEILNVSTGTLHKILRMLGFAYKKTDNRKSLCELSHIVSKRYTFLRNYVQNLHSATSRPFVFLDETWIFSKGGDIRSWQDSSKFCYQQRSKTSNGKRYIVVHAGGVMGFIPGAGEVFASNSKSADYHDSMDGNFFEWWFEEKVLKVLEEGSIILLDNASYHTRKLNPAPTSNWSKGEIIKWLEKNKICFDPADLRANLLQLSRKHAPEPTYVVDQLALQYGHEVLRIPPYHCHFNPIELVWGIAKRKYNEDIGKTNGKEEDVLKVWRDAVNCITEETWATCVGHTQQIILDTFHREQALDEVRPLIFTVNTGESDEETDFSDDEEDDSY